MENSSVNKTRIFKGAGYIIGFAIGSITAILFVAITGIEALIGAIAGAVTIPVGMGLEKKFQEKEYEVRAKGDTLLFIFIAVGTIFLGTIFFINFCI
jgi:hypothetical protein